MTISLTTRKGESPVAVHIHGLTEADLKATYQPIDLHTLTRDTGEDFQVAYIRIGNVTIHLYT